MAELREERGGERESVCVCVLVGPLFVHCQVVVGLAMVDEQFGIGLHNRPERERERERSIASTRLGPKTHRHWSALSLQPLILIETEELPESHEKQNKVYIDLLRVYVYISSFCETLFTVSGLPHRVVANLLFQ